MAHRRNQAKRTIYLAGRKALPLVEEALFSDDPEIRFRCTLLIDRLAGNDSFEVLLLLLDDPDARVRGHAMHALACDRCKADDVCVLPREDLIDAAAGLVADDPDEHVRAVSLEVLGRWSHEDARAAATLEEAAQRDPSPAVRKKAKWYLPGGAHYERLALERERRRRR